MFIVISNFPHPFFITSSMRYCNEESNYQP
uniref:Uncharacterized protein n=1 Tax=Rhizophora mucronata TaxID=61149 RepID=A0A2P2PAC4_RHIMU